MRRKLRKILRKNAEMERKTPYNFCDRWCERCVWEKQKTCSLYLEEFEQRITNIANGRDENDLEIWQNELEKKLQEMPASVSEDTQREWEPSGEYEYYNSGSGKKANCGDEDEYEEEECSDEYLEELQTRKERFLNAHPLQVISEQYMNRSAVFLKEAFPDDEEIAPDLFSHYETVSWYHTLLPSKMYYGLSALCEYDGTDDTELCDTIAEWAVCKKGIKKSVEALREIARAKPGFKKTITLLLALLHNMHSRIELKEQDVTT